MSELTKREEQLQVIDTRYGFTHEQVDVIKATIAPGASNEELALFLMVCQKTGLDPFSRQIYLSERWANGVSKKSPETTIDGFRVIAERSGKYAGQVGPFWCGSDGVWKDVWLDNDMPSAAKVGILRSDFAQPVWGVALFLEYAQYKKARDGQPPQLNSMWQKMGANQLAKCAESLGLRKAFPRDLSGMYTREEMAQADKEAIDNSKQAQADVAERRIKELKHTTPIEYGSGKETPTGVSGQTGQGHDLPGTIREIPPASTPGPSYEQRHAAIVTELADFLDTPPEQPPPAVEMKPKSTRKRGAISFEALKKWGEIKAEILRLTGTTDLYYKALATAGYEHADAIKTLDDAAKIWKALKEIVAEVTPKQQDKALRLELETYQLAMPGERFMAVLGSNGFEDIPHILEQATGDQLQALLAELKQEAKGA